MQQTLLALAAILVFSVYALGRHRADNDVERRAIGIEAELAVTDVALGRLAAVERLAFDEDDVDRAGVRQSPPTSGIGRDAGETAPAHFDDVDDWAGLSDTLAVAVGTDSLRFAVVVDVEYVDLGSPDTAVSTPTLAKRVRVRAQEITAGPSDRPPATADLRRIVTPASSASRVR